MPVLHTDKLLETLYFGVFTTESSTWSEALSGADNTASGTHHEEEVVKGVCVGIDLDIVYYPGSSSLGVPQETKCYAMGSWRRMYLTQPPCAVTWIIRAGLRAGHANTNRKALTCGEQWPKSSYSEHGLMTAQDYVDYSEEQARERSKTDQDEGEETDKDEGERTEADCMLQ